MTDTFLRHDEVTKAAGVHLATIYRWMAKGSFPKQIPIGENSVGWSAAEIAAWQAERLSARETVAA
jgi:prophage regulatory protein